MNIVKYMNIPYAENRHWREGAPLIRYDPFWETLQKRGLSTYALITKHNISSATLDRMRRGGGISTMKIDDFCRILHCRVEDVILYTPDEN